MDRESEWTFGRGFANKSAQKCLSWPVTQASKLGPWSRAGLIKFEDYLSGGCRENSEFSERLLTNIPEWFNVWIGAFFMFAIYLTWRGFLTGGLLINVRSPCSVPRLIPFSHLCRLGIIRPWNDHSEGGQDAKFKNCKFEHRCVKKSYFTFWFGVLFQSTSPSPKSKPSPKSNQKSKREIWILLFYEQELRRRKVNVLYWRVWECGQC